MARSPRTRGSNILILMADQMTPRALGVYGHPLAKTPNIDALAENGVTFDQAYCNSPLCAPARFSLMAGQLVSNIGAWDNAAEFRSDIPTFAHYLRSMNYYTCLSGKMHFVGPDQLHGFEDRVTTDVYPADYAWVPDWERSQERIEDWYHNMLNIKRAGVAAVTHQFDFDEEVGYTTEKRIYELARAPEDTPFCLITSFIHPHDPYTTRQRYWDRFHHDDIDLPVIPAMDYGDLDPYSQRIFDGIARDEFDITDDDIRNARHAYYANVSYLDDWVGRIVAALEETGLRDNTVIILTSDHGDMLGERGLWFKMSLFEPSVRVPLIVSVPGMPRGRRSRAPVSHVDILPTLLDIAGDSGAGAIPEAGDNLDGTSLMPLISGGDGSDRTAISEYMAEMTGRPIYMIRRDRYKYIHCDTDPEQLYDMDADPHEKINLADDASLSEITAAFRAEVADTWDSDAVTAAVIASQRRRRTVHAGMSRGRHTSWDWHPARNPAEEYLRSHQDVSETDLKSQFPAPKNPTPLRPRAGSE